MALERAHGDMLAAPKLRQVPPEALRLAAMNWNENGRAEQTVAVLEPLFLTRSDLDERYEVALDALSDAMRDLGLEVRRRALAQHMSQSPDKALATTARCRMVSMLSDNGDFPGAWVLLQSTQRFAPNDPQVWLLEMTLLLAEGRTQEARLRGTALAARARKAGWDNLAGALMGMANEGLSSVCKPV